MKDVATVRRPRWAAGATLFVVTAATAFALGACADSDNEADPTASENGDGGSVLPATDASRETDAAQSLDGSDDAPSEAGSDAAPRLCSDDSFCHSVVPTGQKLAAVWGDGEGIVWAVSRSGDVLRWDGIAWSVHSRLTSASGTNYAIWGSGPTDVWVVTPAGVFHGEGPSSASLVFAPITLPGDPSIPILSVEGTGPKDIWAVGGFMNSMVYPWVWKGRVLRYDGDTSDGRSGWKVDEALAPPNVAFSVVRAAGDGGAWIVGQEYRKGVSPSQFAVVYRHAPGSTNWVAVDLPPDPAGGWGPHAQEIFAAGLSSANTVWLRGATNNYAYGFWRGTSTDGQTFSWSFSPINTWDRAIVALWGTGLNDTWGVGGSGLVTHWTGAKWKQAAIRVTDLPVSKSFAAIWGKSNDDFWVVGDEIALHKTTAGKP